ncbi:MAG TPA: DUF1622 domain-containing protein [Phycisphaerales bacterium]|nr:DUF1622 domain-containing protein [Phycisphaerales bacterium]
MAPFSLIVERVGMCVDGAGVLVIVIGLAISTFQYIAASRRPATGAYRAYRQNLGRTILLGLELLVAGDIIRTVAVAPTLSNVMVLGLIVLIRTFLSMSIQLELEGRWPWQPAKHRTSGSVPVDE